MSATKKIDARSESAAHNGLEFFSLPHTQVAVNRAFYREILPLSSTGESPFEFKVYSDANYLDLSKTFLYLKLSIEKWKVDKWIPLESTDICGPVQSIGSSFIKQLRVNISGNDVYDSTNLHAYLSYIQNELNYSQDFKNTVLAAAGYYEEDVDQNAEENRGHIERAELANQGRIFESYAKVDLTWEIKLNFY